MVEHNEIVMVSLNVVQEMMKVQKEAILSCFNIMENLSKKDLKSGSEPQGRKKSRKVFRNR